MWSIFKQEWFRHPALADDHPPPHLIETTAASGTGTLFLTQVEPPPPANLRQRIITRRFYGPGEGREVLGEVIPPLQMKSTNVDTILAKFPVLSTWVAMEGKMVVKKGGKLPGVGKKGKGQSCG
jgi:hypothetical protein